MARRKHPAAQSSGADGFPDAGAFSSSGSTTPFGIAGGGSADGFDAGNHASFGSNTTKNGGSPARNDLYFGGEAGGSFPGGFGATNGFDGMSGASDGFRSTDGATAFPDGYSGYGGFPGSTPPAPVKQGWFFWFTLLSLLATGAAFALSYLTQGEARSPLLVGLVFAVPAALLLGFMLITEAVTSAMNPHFSRKAQSITALIIALVLLLMGTMGEILYRQSNVIPANYVIALDRSGSMDKLYKHEMVNSGISMMLDNMDESNNVGYLSFHEKVYDQLPMRPLSFSDHKAAIKEMADQSPYSSWTAFYPPLKHALEMIESTNLPTKILLVTDGYEEVPEVPIPTPVPTPSPTPPPPPSDMAALVEAVGGETEGKMRFSLKWGDRSNMGNVFDDDLDLSCMENPIGGSTASYRIYFSNKHITSPNGGTLDMENPIGGSTASYRIYFSNKHITSPNGGTLDVDMIPKDQEWGTGPFVENIIYPDYTILFPGTYLMTITCYEKKDSNTGFHAELMVDDTLYRYAHAAPLQHKQQVDVAEVTVHQNGSITVNHLLPHQEAVLLRATPVPTPSATPTHPPQAVPSPPPSLALADPANMADIIHLAGKKNAAIYVIMIDHTIDPSLASVVDATGGAAISANADMEIIKALRGVGVLPEAEDVLQASLPRKPWAVTISGALFILGSTLLGIAMFFMMSRSGQFRFQLILSPILGVLAFVMINFIPSPPEKRWILEAIALSLPCLVFMRRNSAPYRQPPPPAHPGGW